MVENHEIGRHELIDLKPRAHETGDTVLVRIPALVQNVGIADRRRAILGLEPHRRLQHGKAMASDHGLGSREVLEGEHDVVAAPP